MASNTSRTMIAALQVSLDGFTLRLIVHPTVLGRGQALFGGVSKRLSLDLVQAKSTESGRVIMSYRT